ncbi:MAG: pirin family protein [Pseudomonadota bacterium]
MTDRIRTIKTRITPRPVIEGAGVRLKRSIALPELDHVDPFLLFDHFGSDNPADYLKGFPLHPHRGIETVTYMMAGKVDHKDSIGNAGSIFAGDVQWMTSGSGIMHEEMPQPVDGRMEGFQLWVNLPARLKMSDPNYQEFTATQLPVVTLENGTRITVIAGAVDGVQGPVTQIAIAPVYIDVTLPAGAGFSHPVTAGHTAIAYVFKGGGRFADGNVLALTMAVFDDGDRVQATAGDAGMRFLLMSGAPLNEAIARYGPFVMNTRAEIEEALQELRNGTFVKISAVRNR